MEKYDGLKKLFEIKIHTLTDAWIDIKHMIYTGDWTIAKISKRIEKGIYDFYNI